MNSTFKTIMYVILGFMVVSLVARLFFNMLPYIFLIGFILFAYFKIKGYFIGKRREKTSYSNTKTYSSNNESQYSASTVEEEGDDDVVSEVIDVDYKEVE